MLGLQRQAAAVAEILAPLAGNLVRQEVSAIELDRRLGGPHLQEAARRLFIERRRGRELAALAVQDPVVVVPAAEAELLVRAPISQGIVKSNGVPFTGVILPVGIRPAVTGVMLSAKIVSS